MTLWKAAKMPLEGSEIERRIKDALPGAEVELVDLAGDNDHWAVTVTWSGFDGMNRVKQHQAVYAAFGSDMGTTLHALKVTTKTA